MIVERFSGLLLEEGEVLLLDVAADEVGSRSGDGEVEITPGRFRVGSRNVFFDPEDWTYPIVRIALEDLRVREDDRHSALRDESNWSTPGKWGMELWLSHVEFNGENALRINAKRYLELKRMGLSHPYVLVNGVTEFVFEPRFGQGRLVRNLVFHLLELANMKSPGTTEFLRRRMRDKKVEELIRAFEQSFAFDIAFLELGVDEALPRIEMPITVIHPLCSVFGRLWVTDQNLYFMPIHRQRFAVERKPLNLVDSVQLSFYGKEDRALEISFSSISSMPAATYAFESSTARDAALFAIESIIPVGTSQTAAGVHQATQAWMARKISNFDYLMELNRSAGRSFNDFSQYPVFPWVIADYESTHLDLNNAESFRDLSKPIAALNEKRLRICLERFSDMGSSDIQPRFLFGTHYSTAAYVIFFLVRCVPDAALKLQSGTFDSDRLFISIAETWTSANTHTSDVKELIPEFFACYEGDLPPEAIITSESGSFVPGDFLLNLQEVDFGVRQDGRWVRDVELPRWASSAEDFIKKNRYALESDFVSENLHKWIDLVFGFRSRSLRDNNLFYTDAVDLQSLESSVDLDLDRLFLEFGRSPRQLFSSPHPARAPRAYTKGPTSIFSEQPPTLPGESLLGLVRCLEFEESFIVTGCALGGPLIAITSELGSLRVYGPLPKLSRAREIQVCSSALRCVRFITLDIVACAGDEGRLYVVDAMNGRVIHIHAAAHPGPITFLDTDMSLSSQGRSLLITGGADAVRGWVVSGESSIRLAYDLDPEGKLISLSASIDSHLARVACLRDDGSLLVWLLPQGGIVDAPMTDPLQISCPCAPVSLHGSQQLLAWTSNTRLVFLSSLQVTMFEVFEVPEPSIEGQPSVFEVNCGSSITTCGAYFFVGFSNGIVRVMSSTGEEICSSSLETGAEDDKVSALFTDERHVIAVTTQKLRVFRLRAKSDSDLCAYMTPRELG
uniref:BEACH domain-containing protein n=1 Tax=Compsopogon caeruleus TaxID=31354 RepID=A0A7S1TI36_9RHOD|mmetsp:Transcript_7207/g.14813  ORF Transcript_7207/g.14813 Transcript_7207/m.14813 type:complete len:960 (+) Transcript_7207:140-3019(+)